MPTEASFRFSTYLALALAMKLGFAAIHHLAFGRR